MMFVFFNTKGVTSGAETANYSGSTELSSIRFSGIRVTQSLVFMYVDIWLD